jgi:hypothetical protein
MGGLVLSYPRRKICGSSAGFDLAEIGDQAVAREAGLTIGGGL